MLKFDSPAADRNKEPIWQVLKTKVLQPGYYNDREVTATTNPPASQSVIKVLETAAGHGIHTQYFVTKWSEELGLSSPAGVVEWIPTDPDPRALVSIQAYLDDMPKGIRQHILPPSQLTFTDDDYQDELAKGFRERQQMDALLDNLDLLININMVHISPWPCTLNLLKTAGDKLRVGGALFLYGPYKMGGTCVESNQRFDELLRARDPRHGIRDLEQVVDAAQRFGLEFVEKIDMPANNLSVIFRKQSRVKEREGGDTSSLGGGVL